MSDCVFCRIVAGDEPATIVRGWRDAIAFVPLNPVCEGHVLVVPTAHYCDASESPSTTGRMFAYAASLTLPPFNLITSVGAAATQTIRHLHVHVVPRREGDGLTLPWTGQVGVDA